MKQVLIVIAFLVAVLVLAVGLLFLCAATKQPSRLWLALALIVIGGAVAAWSGLTWRRTSELRPGRLADRITELVRRSGQAEVTLAQVVGQLQVPTDAALDALALLKERGLAHLERRGDKEVYLFPGLVESKVMRRCPYCGNEYSIREPLHKCPNCGGTLEVVKE
jgi:hypothetical protein